MIERVRRSLVLRLSLAFACATLVLVGLGGLYLQYSLGQILLRQGEDELRLETGAIVRRLERAPEQVLQNLGESYQIRVFDAAGRITLQSEGIDLAVPPQPGQAPAPVMIRGRHRVMVLGAPFRSGWVQVIRDFSNEDRRLAHFRQGTVMRLFFTVLAVALAGYVIARKGLVPLQHLAEQAGKIHPESLSTRLKLEDAPLELEPLARSLNQALARLEASFARLSELSADMAHELRTPVHALKLEAERILSAGELKPATEDALVGMMETLDHMGTLISQMLFLAKSEDPATVIQPVDLDVAELLSSVREPFEPLAEEREIRLELDVPASFRLRGDATLLRRALHNLVDNAIRYAPRGTAVVLRAVSLPAGARLEVADHGEGVPEDFQMSIGRRFLRSDHSRSRVTGGAGLGLAIVHSIAKLHGATFSLVSGPGQGTLGRLDFPRT